MMRLARILAVLKFSYQPLISRWPIGRKLTLFFASALIAWLTAYWIPQGEFALGLSPVSRQTLFLLVFSLCLWVTEAVPAFAVSILIVGYQIFVLGSRESDGVALEKYTRAWSSPVIWIMLGGFFLSLAMSRSVWIRHFALKVVALGEASPGRLLLILMAITALLSMFISNTASTSLVLGLMLPVISRVASRPEDARAFLVAIPAAASIGGMGTIVGSTPNAIAYSYLRQAGDTLTFIRWAAIGIPMVFVLCLAVWAMALLLFRPLPKLSLSVSLLEEPRDVSSGARDLSSMEQWIVLFTFFATVSLWTFSTLYQVSVAEVSFLPIILLTVTGIIRSTDIRELPWDTLLLVMGGLSLGESIAESGLATHLATLLKTSSEFPLMSVLVFAYFSALFSNFMSNTAAASILIPLGNEVIPGHTLQVTLIIALSASAATMLPISTPPNAIAAATGYVRTRDFLKLGTFLLVVAPLLLTLFVWLLAGSAPN